MPRGLARGLTPEWAAVSPEERQPASADTPSISNRPAGLVHDHERGADRARGGKMLRHRHLGFRQGKHFAEGPAHAEVRGHAAEEQKRRMELFALAHGGLEIPGHGKTEPGHDIVIRRGALLEMDHVALGKDTAPARNTRRLCGFEGDGAELFDREMKARGLLIEKRSGARGAGRIHGKVFDPDTQR